MEDRPSSAQRGPSSATCDTGTGPAWLPDWIHQIGAAIWVCDPHQRLAYANERAAALIQHGRDSLGRASFECVGGRADGSGSCRSRCDFRRRAEDGRELLPALWRRTSVREGWLMVVPIPLAAPDGSGTWILHVAQPLEELERMRSYVERLAGRSEERDPQGARAALARLTRREREILWLLCADQDPAAIARRLFLSPVTVRNHVQHVLVKLGVHSTQEAVALQLLHAEGNERPRPG